MQLRFVAEAGRSIKYLSQVQWQTVIIAGLGPGNQNMTAKHFPGSNEYKERVSS